jgi:hypothetical protein
MRAASSTTPNESFFMRRGEDVPSPTDLIPNFFVRPRMIACEVKHSAVTSHTLTAAERSVKETEPHLNATR